MEQFLEIIKLLLPAAIVLYGVYLTVKTFLNKRFEESLAVIREKNHETILPLRLQAYERLTILLERMQLANLLPRLTDHELTAQEFQHVLMSEIKAEFNHNVSQQIYVSEEVWDMVMQAKEELVSLINHTTHGMEPGANSLELSKRLVEQAMSAPNDFNQVALRAMKKEVRELF